MDIKCLKCKGRGFCGRSFCPIIAKSEALFKVKEQIGKEDFSGSSPSPFVGHYGYPYLNVGFLSLPQINEDAWIYDAPRYWSMNEFQIKEIVDFRSSLINSRFKAHAHDRNRLLEIGQEIGMASKPVELEVSLAEKPKFKLNTDAYLLPMGPNANLKKAEITANPKIPAKIDRVVRDVDLKANDALIYLYEHDFDENYLTKLLSIGTLGLKKSRKLVPTRWSITATDDAVAKHLIEEIKGFNQIDYSAYFGSYLGNYYLVLFFPEKWSYELFEMYMPNASWNVSSELNYMTDYENYDGRKNYAENCGGGYYSVRLAVLEKLREMKKQGTALVLRFITGEYAVPLGVWVTREAARKALLNKPIIFSDKELMLKYAKMLVKKKFGYDLGGVLRKSIILDNLRSQIKLAYFV